MKVKRRDFDRPMMACHVHGCTQIASLVIGIELLRGYCDKHDPRMEAGCLEIIIDISKALAELTRDQLHAFTDIEDAQAGNLAIHFDYDPDGITEEQAAHTDDPERRADLETRLERIRRRNP